MSNLANNSNKNDRRQAKNNLEKTVINKSDYVLSTDELSVLKKGLNFAITPKRVPVCDIIASVESSINRIADVNIQDEIRWKTRSILSKERKLKPNLNHQEVSAIKHLKSNKNIVILPADKGNATILLNKTTYDSKISELFCKGTYTKITKDPTSKIERKVYAILKKNEEFIDKYTRTKLTPHHSKPPHLYGLPKIHKDGIPLRPIISSRDSPCYDLSKYLLKILTPLSGTSGTTVKNSTHFIELTKTFNLAENDYFVSFDVESLFTNVPVLESLVIIRSKLEQDDELMDRCDLPVNSIMELLTCCLTTTYFQVNDEFYEQNDGMPMGSPLSPLIANIFMEFFEDLALSSFVKKPKVWLRYVDDTFAIMTDDRTNIEDFLQHLNNLRPSINFTIELEKNNQLPFLDVLVTRNNNMVSTAVYKKPTNTGRYLNFGSNHPHCTKLGVARSLVDRARAISSNENILKQELQEIQKTLQNNGYPRRIFQQSLKERHEKHPEEQNTLIIPYVNGISERLSRMMTPYGITTRFQAKNTIRSFLVKTKPESSADFKNCIYKIPCECGENYIGETKRPLAVRVKEHKELTRKGETTKSKLAEHSWEKQHHVAWDKAKIIRKETNAYKRKFMEASIMLCNTNIISNPSVEIKPIWTPLIKANEKLRLHSDV